MLGSGKIVDPVTVVRNIVGVIAAIWIEKGMGMVVTGFVPSPLGRIAQYVPTQQEILITVGVYAIGFLVLSVLYRIVVGVREQMEVAYVKH